MEDKIKQLLKYYEKYIPVIVHDSKIYEILEGDLLKHVIESLRRQIEGDTVNVAIQRAAPINVLIKIISKLSKLYSQPVTRKTVNPGDQELIDYYVKRGVNLCFQNFNENFNAYKKSLIEIYEDEEERTVGFRALTGKSFLPLSYSKVDPLRLSAYLKIMGHTENGLGRLWYTDKDQFLSFNTKGEKIITDMTSNEGVNPYGVLPAVYQCRSDYELIPIIDSDIVAMTVLISILITDQNFASMFLSQPILYGLDIDVPDNAKVSPNYFWSVKSTSVDGKTGTLGVLKAEPNLEAQMKNVIDQLQLWLSTKDIRPGTVTNTQSESFSSAISKVVGEMDTIENRNAQIPYMLKAEKDFWFKLATIHNYLAQAGRIENRQLFSDPKTLEVTVTYAEAAVIETRSEKVTRIKAEMDAKLMSREDALKELYPNESEEEIDARIQRLNEERMFSVDETMPMDVVDGETTQI